MPNRHAWGVVGARLGEPTFEELRTTRPGVRCAFTLIELVVVIVAFALLAGMVLALGCSEEPARERHEEPAAEASRMARTKCLAKVRRIALAAHMHVADHNGRLPLAGLPRGVPSFTPRGMRDPHEIHHTYYTDHGTRRVAPMVMQLGAYMGIEFRHDSRNHVEQDIQRDEVVRLFQCPALDDVQKGFIVPGGEDGWQDAIAEPCSYGFNEALLAHRDRDSHTASGPCPAGNLADVFNPQETLFCLDAKPGRSGRLVFFDALPDGADQATFANYWTEAGAHGRGAGVHFERHDQCMNAVFADGHCESVPTGESADEPALDAWDQLYVIHWPPDRS